MSAVTPIYGFPYNTLTDSPNGAAATEALARAVETKISSVDATNNAQNSSISSVQSTLNTLNTRSLGGRLVQTPGIIHAGITTTEVNITKLQFENSSITAGRVYMFNLVMNMLYTVLNDTFLMRVRKDTPLSGTVVATQYTVDSSALAFLYYYMHRPWLAPASDADADFYVSVQRVNGTGSCDIRGDGESCFWIDEIVTPTDWQFIA